MAASLDIPTQVDLELYHQAEQGDTRAQKQLGSLANTGWVSDKGLVPIQFAAANGLVKVVRMLAQERPQDLHVLQEDGWTLLHLAAFYGHFEVAELLVHKFKAKVDERD